MPRYRVAGEQVLSWYTGRPATCFCHCHVMLSNRGKGPLDDSGAPSADAFQGTSSKGGEVHDEPPSYSRNHTRALVVHVSSGFYKPGRNGLGRSEGADGRSAHTTEQGRHCSSGLDDAKLVVQAKLKVQRVRCIETLEWKGGRRPKLRMYSDALRLCLYVLAPKGNL